MADKKSIFNNIPVTDKHYKIYKWCCENKLINRDKKGNFNLDKTIKVKYLAIILYRFYNFIKKNWGLM